VNSLKTRASSARPLHTAASPQHTKDQSSIVIGDPGKHSFNVRLGRASYNRIGWPTRGRKEVVTIQRIGLQALRQARCESRIALAVATHDGTIRFYLSKRFFS
jgi:hypothetical protein